MNRLKADDKVWYKPNTLRGVGTVLEISKSGKTALVKWPDPYNTGSKPTYCKIKSLKMKVGES